MHKFFKPLSEENVKILKGFAKKDFSNFSEADIREEVITPIIRMLGYEKNTDYEVEREETFETKEMFLNVGRKRIDLDYLCNVRKNNFWLIEAKNGKNKELTEEELQQAYLYSLHPKVNCRYFAVTNGWFFNLYDRNKYIKDENSDIFEPVLSIKHTEYNEKFIQLYQYLGSSNVLFNVKEDVILGEIKKTMSSEVYLNRLNYFEKKVSNIIRESERNVYCNIGKLEDDAKEYEKYLKSLKFQILPMTLFARRNIHKNLDIGCSVIKEKLLDLNKYCTEDYSPLDSFIRELLPTEHVYCINLFEPAYYYNIISILKAFYYDKDYGEMWCRYNNKKFLLSELLEEYLYELYSFFPNKPHVRLLIYLYTITYRLAKMIVYGIDPIKKIAEFCMIKNEYLLSEEELGKIFYSKRNELIYFVEILTARIMNITIQQMFDKNYNILVEKTECLIKNLEATISDIDRKIDYKRIQQQLNEDEKDGMMAADDDIENPWRLILFAVSNILPANYKQSERCQEQLDKINQIGLNYNNEELNEQNRNRQREILEILKYDFSIKKSIL